MCHMKVWGQFFLFSNYGSIGIVRSFQKGMRFWVWLITELGSPFFTFIRPHFVGTQQLLRLKKQWWIFGRFSSIIPLICHHLVQSKCKLSFEQKLLYELKSQRKVLSLRRCLFRQPKIAQNYISFTSFHHPQKLISWFYFNFVFAE